MVERKEVYKCSVCGNIVEVLHGGGGTLVCCGKNMDLMVEQFEEEGKTEKHRPVIDGKKVRVGSVAHPMTEEHYIEWIEVFPKEGRSLKVFLKPGDLPEVEVCFEPERARAYCNLHGLWKS
jgi:superoxide reductase